MHDYHVSLLVRNPDQCPTVVALLAESFNPHVRCGAAWALGIACAASGNKVRQRDRPNEQTDDSLL